MSQQKPNELEKLLTGNPPAKRGISLGSIVLYAGIIMAVATVGFALTRQNANIAEGSPVPSFALTTFDSELFDLADYRGQIVVINFWASWCGPCRYEAPDLEAVHREYADQGVVLIGIAWSEASEQDSLDFIEEFRLTYRNGPNGQSDIADRYGISGVPETFVVGRDGNLVEGGYFPGPVTGEQLRRLLDTLISVELARGS